MTTILFVFALLTTPTDKYICTLWTRALTSENVIAACGVELLNGLRVDVYDLDNKFICSKDAIYMNDIAELQVICEMDKPLDAYILKLVKPSWSEIICFVRSESKDKPSADEVKEQCDWAPKKYDVEYLRDEVQEPEPPAFSCPARDLPVGFGLYNQSISATSLLTSEDLTWLAGQLIWNGHVRPQCENAGVNPNTMIATPCGMAAARDQVVKWQNQFDQDIYDAALANNVPAKLLKRMIRMESQFWPFYTAPTGENGVMQITDNGLDTLLRFDNRIDPNYFDRNDEQKLWSRSVTRDSLYCINCTLDKAVKKTKNNMSMYARLLAAFHCRAVTINPALTGDSAWQQAIVDYNGNADYLRRIEQ
jgi:hypothetical protein